MAKPSLKLTEEQERLLTLIPQRLRRETALAYISNGYMNQTQAYLLACKKINRKPSKNPKTSASEILKNPNVLGFIESVKVIVAEEAQVNSSYVLNRLIEIDSLDVIDILNPDGSMKPIIKWPKSWRTSITGIDVQEMMSGDIATVIKKIKWPDKLKNLELLGRHVNIKAFEGESKKEDTVIQKVLIEVISAS